MCVNRGENIEMGTHCKDVGSLVFLKIPMKHGLVITYSFLESRLFWPLIQKVLRCFKNLKPS